MKHGIEVANEFYAQPSKYRTKLRLAELIDRQWHPLNEGKAREARIDRRTTVLINAGLTPLDAEEIARTTA